ncbi:MAG: SDR family NAD(P)-dependent oxidoreductase [Saccharofermentanales bacterium]|jgi:NAD(P)-dependent dehydrogenase (short-subunit alcohol dehydrogenase family)
MSNVVVVSGGSSGIGAATCKLFAKRGDIVYDLSRTGKDRQGIRHLYCDVKDPEAVREAIQTVLSNEKRIDICVSNAGYGIAGTVECTSDELAINQMDVNFHGTERLARAVLPALKESRGKFIAVSSVAGTIPIPFQAYYSASKAAMQSLLLAMANEVRPFGVSVVCIQPGDLSTGFTDKRVSNPDEASDYGETVHRSIRKMADDERKGGSPLIVAKRIVKIAAQQNPKPLQSLGWFYKTALTLWKLLPIRITNYVVGKLYAS